MFVSISSIRRDLPAPSSPDGILQLDRIQLHPYENSVYGLDRVTLKPNILLRRAQSPFEHLLRSSCKGTPSKPETPHSGLAEPLLQIIPDLSLNPAIGIQVTNVHKRL